MYIAKVNSKSGKPLKPTSFDYARLGLELATDSLYLALYVLAQRKTRGQQCMFRLYAR